MILFFYNSTSVSAKEYILERSKKEEIIILNELHHNASINWLIIDLSLRLGACLCLLCVQVRHLYLLDWLTIVRYTALPRFLLRVWTMLLATNRGQLHQRNFRYPYQQPNHNNAHLSVLVRWHRPHFCLAVNHKKWVQIPLLIMVG